MMAEIETYKKKFAFLQTLSALVNRMGLASRLNTMSFDGMRHIYEALGYPLVLKFDDYFARYDRQDIAKAIIDKPVNKTWQGQLGLGEADDKEVTQLETEFGKLVNEFGLKSIFNRVDKLTGLGRYGVLVMGFSDVKVVEDWLKPVAGKVILKYLKPFSEKSAVIKKFVKDVNDKRFGLPLTYEIQVKETPEGEEKKLEVHYSRVIHIVDDILESEIEGTPRLKAVFNRLMDLEKLVGGDAEMFWKGARPGYAGKVDKDYQMTPETETALKEQLDEYEHNLRRMLINEGVSYQSLAQQVSDPMNHVDIQIQMISAVTGIPKRILTGSERGQLASTQDSSEWKEYIASRREVYAEIRIVRPFVERMIQYKILPKPQKEYYVKWDDVFAVSEKEKVDIGNIRTQALKAYASSPLAESVLPPDAFLNFFLGLNNDQITLIKEMRDAQIANEPVITLAEQASIDKQKGTQGN